MAALRETATIPNLRRAQLSFGAAWATTRLRVLRLSGQDLVCAVTGYTPSLSEAEALVERRLATPVAQAGG